MRIKTTKKWGAFWVCLCLFCSTLQAAPPNKVELRDNQDHYTVDSQLYYFIDTTSQIGIAEASSPSFQSMFLPNTRKDVTSEHMEDYIWLRLTVDNQRQTPNQSWYFESWGFDISHITFYVPLGNGQFLKREMGNAVDFHKRNIYHKNFEFLLGLRPGETKTYYIRIKRSYPMQFSFHIRTNEAFLFHALNEYLFLGFYHGFLLIVLCFSLYLTVKLREQLYAYFSLLVAATMWYSFGRDGLGFQYLWPSYPEINNFTSPRILALFLVVTTIIYAGKFVEKTVHYPLIKRLTYIAVAFKVVIFIFEATVAPLPSTLSLIINLLLMGVPFVAGINAQIRINQFSWAYLIAFSCLFLAFIQDYTSHMNLISNPVINWYIFNAGILLEVVFFVFSILNHMAFLRQENEATQQEKITILEENNRIKDELNNKLEERVQARTKEVASMAKDLAAKNVELEEKNGQLKKLNSQVTEMNKLLSRDNEQLQTDIEAVSRARVLMQGVDFEGFKETFPEKEACLSFLAGLKWANGYKCKKCGYNRHSEGRIPHGRRCKNCNYDESPTTGTLFHKLKFPIEKAFYIVYLTNRNEAGLTLNELSEVLDLRRETCWAFKQKVLAAMEKSGHNRTLDGWESLAMITTDSPTTRT